ncbi:MAG: ankyrin repeat domain-containing protein [Planctomycetes bacterium]|nr:ankyrin repeat domain-containing protein [Planctomycetota bacterium]
MDQRSRRRGEGRASGRRQLARALRTGAWLALLGFTSPARARAGTSPAESPSLAAVSRALPLLQQSAMTWFTKRSCISCHHQSLGALTVALARERGVAVDEALAKALDERVAASLPAAREDVLLGDAGINAQVGLSWKLLGLAASGYAADLHTDARVRFLAAQQHQDGSWRSGSRRPPLEDSDLAATAVAVRVLQLAAPPGRAEEFAERVARARRWLVAATPRDGEELALRLFGLAWSGAAPTLVEAASRELAQAQRSDGGFAQLPTRASDAYATGQALLALNQAGGMAIEDPAWQRGAAYLRSTQLPDGSWHVATRRFGEGLAPFDSGFPHDDDQFISYAASAYATSALLLEQRPGRSPLWSTITPLPRAATTVVEPPLPPLVEAILAGDAAAIDRALAAEPADASLAAAGRAGLTPLMAALPDAALVARLLQAGAPIEARAQNGRTATWLAAAQDGALESLRLLLRAGADARAADGRGATPLHAAALSGDVRKTELLLAHGAAIDAVDAEGCTPLVFAGFQGDVAMVEWLIDHGATPNATVATGESALLLATQDGRDKVALLLLAKGANVAARDAEGRTALHWAARVDRGDSRLLERLLAAGADLHAKANDGATPLSIARASGHLHHVAALRAAGARE